MSASPDPPPAAHAPPRRRVPIATILAVTLAGLVGIGIASVIAINFWVGRETTLEFVRERGELLVSTIEGRLREQLEPAATQLAFIADLLAHRVEPHEDGARVADLLAGALSATPQIARLSFIDPDLQSITAERDRDAANTQRLDLSALPGVREGMDEASRSVGGRWGEIVFTPRTGETLVNRRHSVWRAGRFIGGLLGVVSVRQLSQFLVASQRLGVGNAFVLIDRENVLAHPNLTRPEVFQPTSEHPLPRLDQVEDPVLAAIWTRPVEPPLFRSDIGMHVVRVEGVNYLFMHRTIYTYGTRPWMIGIWAEAREAASEMRRVVLTAAAGLAVLLLAVIAAIWLGRRVSRPVTRLALAARQVRTLEFGRMPDLPRSRLAELDDQAAAFNDMLAGLRWFEAYVPRAIVRRLARRGSGTGTAAALPSVEREMTVMFTDIAGFTSVSERMRAAETAALLNHHFGLITAAVEAERGTLDKFIGDGALAFWGAPERRPDHPARAAAAALRIAAAVADDNRLRAARGLAPIRVRIGLHTGRAVVGNIGAPGRINYTIVGDAVNIAQRIEQLGRELGDGDSEVTILISGTTAARLGSAFAVRPVGRFTLKGRAEVVPVYRLAPEEDRRAAAAPRGAAASST